MTERPCGSCDETLMEKSVYVLVDALFTPAVGRVGNPAAGRLTPPAGWLAGRLPAQLPADDSHRRRDTSLPRHTD